jgi:putative DNA topoisomerase
LSKIDHTLFGAQSHALSEAYGDCPLCSSTLVIRRSKSGPFVGCSSYPECSYTKPLHDNEIHTIKTIDGSSCPECSSLLAIKKGRYGLFIGCTNVPECHHIESLKSQEKTSVECPKCKSGTLNHRTNRFGKAFWSCSNYPKCKYIVNSEPVSKSCVHCGWGIVVKKGDKFVCPDSSCGKVQPD